MELAELNPSLTPCEYAKLLHKQMTEGFDLIQTNTSHQHQCQKELYDSKIHGKPSHQPADVVTKNYIIHGQGYSRF